MYILGISCYYHDASAALLKDGKIVAAAEEERFSRKKHDTSFPAQAIRFCLESEGIDIGQVEYVGFYEKPMLKFERVLYQHLQMFPKSLKTFLISIPSWLHEKLRIVKKCKKVLGYKGDILFIEHHLAHAASTFYPSPFHEAAIVTVDGVGEWTTTAYGRGLNTEIELHKQISFPHSLGLLYSTITAYLGFSVNNSEYKVMGLSAHGEMDREKNPYYRKLLRVIDVKDDGSFHLDMTFFVYHYKSTMPSEKLCRLLGGDARGGETAIEQRHKDIAAALQMIYEDTLFRILRHVHSETGLSNLVLAGGCALNSVANGKILQKTPFEDIWIQPNASDGGTSIGVALYMYHAIFGNERNYHMNDAFLGTHYSADAVRRFLDDAKITYSEFSDDSKLLRFTADLIYNNNVVGWFQGKMEWGPRALGSRSILSNPMNPRMQEILNEKVKHREKFRPFAPVVCREDAQTYFECDDPVPLPADFMLMVYPIKREWREVIPAVTHVDGSGRLQTVRREQNPLYYDLIKQFGELSGIPILINTSFNIRGEPIVCSPFDAYRCMMGTGIDYLVIGRFLVAREKNARDMWDSEQYAKD